MPHHRFTPFILWLFLLAPPILNAAEPSLKKLSSFGEWSRLCTANGHAHVPCMHRLTRPSEGNGRGAENFSVPSVNAKILMTRSGVLLKPEINRKIITVPKDIGAQTSIALQSGIQCITFAVHGKNVTEMKSKATYDAFVRYITDDSKAEIETLESSDISGRPAVRFTQSNDGLIGAYLVDTANNAGIWAACIAGEGLTPQALLDDFLSDIIGSARRY